MLDPDVLISPIFSQDSLTIAGPSKSFNVYIHPIAGPVSVANGTNISQIINAIQPSTSLLNHASAQFQKISSKVDLKFILVDHPEQADISIYLDSEINLGDDSVFTLGVTTTNFDISSDRSWFEIFLNGPLIQQIGNNIESYVFNHELLHALGLEHTFDDSDGDFYLSTDPQSSATPDQTVMSYITPPNYSYPSDITASDYNALRQIWGFADSITATTHQTTVYRLYDPVSDRHLFSTNNYEIDFLTGSDSLSSFINEGIAYTVQAGAKSNLYRFYRPNSNSHFYTASDSERDMLLRESPTQFLYEGVVYKIFLPTEAPLSSTPVFRYFDPVLNDHFYTSSSLERQNLEFTKPHWVNEGIAWYV